MPVFRWGHAWDPLRDLEREVDRLLQGMSLGLQGFRPGRQFPSVNVYEKSDSFLVVAEVPGMELGDFELSTSLGVLTLKGERKAPAEATAEIFRRQERFHGTWKRTIQLPDRVDEDNLRAEYTAGILRVTLPKAGSSRIRRIPVSDGADSESEPVMDTLPIRESGTSHRLPESNSENVE